MSSRTLLFASLAFASLSLFGCDPGMPGVAGQADLGAGVDAAQFQNLEMRAIPAEGVFNPLSPVFPTAISDNLYQDGEGGASVWTGDIESQERE